MRTFQNVSSKEIGINTYTSFDLLAVSLYSSAMYPFENQAQPDKFSSIQKLLVGRYYAHDDSYGDIYPVTPLGKIIGGIIAFLGIGLFAITR